MNMIIDKLEKDYDEFDNVASKMLEKNPLKNNGFFFCKQSFT